jgi:hypothetical protein
MPIHINPAIRAMEEAKEAAGLIVPLDGASVTIEKSLEASGQKVKILHAVDSYSYNDHKYKPK